MNTETPKTIHPSLLLTALLCLFLVALPGPGRPAEAAFPGQNGSIAFEHFGDIYLAVPDGSVAREIDVAGVQANPAVSPDGTRVAYEYGRGIWVMGSDGGGKVNVIADNGTGDNHPTFSPDGGRIAFNSNRPNGNPTAVYTVGTDGGAVVRLAASSGFDNDPDWGALDAAAPEVGRVTPAEGARNVSPKANVTVAFSEAMDASTLDRTTFSLRKKGAAGVAARVSYDAATRRAVLDPVDALRPGTTYVATVGGVEDLAGKALAAGKTWSFTVRR